MRWLRLPASPSSNPAVSIRRISTPPISVRTSCRSRVTPGVSWTIASLLPASRLKSVDLPTLGRPTMAMVRGMAFPSASAQCHELGFVGQQIERSVCHHRRDIGATRNFHPARQRARIGRNRFRIAVGGHHHEAVGYENGASPDDRLVLVVRIFPARKLMRPLHLAVLALKAKQRGVGGQHINEVAGGPWRLNAADIARPCPLAGIEVD